jgi:hypothetical protein
MLRAETVSFARHLFAAALALPVSAVFSPSQMEAEAGAFGARLGAIVREIHSAVVPLPPPPVPVAPLELAPEEGAAEAAPAAGHGKQHKRGAKAGKSSPFAGGIFIGKDTVLRLARAGTVPGATPVAATKTRPGGLALSGVGALGLGLSDGDILTEVDGQPVRSEGQVVGLVVGARSRHAEQVSAVVFRTGAGERWSLVVAMPYL